MQTSAKRNSDFSHADRCIHLPKAAPVTIGHPPLTYRSFDVTLFLLVPSSVRFTPRPAIVLCPLNSVEFLRNLIYPVRLISTRTNRSQNVGREYKCLAWRRNYSHGVLGQLENLERFCSS